MAGARRGFLTLLGAGAATAAAIVYVGLAGPDGLPSLPGLSPEAVEVSVASSVTKRSWLEAAAAGFQADDPRTKSGKPIRITISNVLSGDSMLAIQEGRLTPTVWSPGESAWVDQLDQGWQGARPAHSQACAPVVLTPVGLAMWKPMAEALGWPDRKVGWKTLVDLANAPDGWAGYGHSEWGRLKLGHTHPQYSSAGLLFLASVIYGVTGKTEGITPADVYDPKVETALRALAQNTARYGMVTTDLLNGMAAKGPDFLHVAAAFEEGTVRMNRDKADALRWPLVFLFPQEGTFWSDHPYCVMDGLPGADPEAAEAAAMFRDHLLSAPVQAVAGDYLVRPLDPAVPLGPALSQATGTDPSANPGNVPPFSLPSPDLSKAIIDQFLTTKRKATVVLALDVSGSMGGERIASATTASSEFIRRLNRDDRLGVLLFSSTVQALGPVAPVSAVGEERAAQVAGLFAGGGTAMNDAVCEAARIVEEEGRRDRAAGDNRLYGIVLLSDGADSSSATSTEKMMATCLKRAGAGSETGETPRIFVIAYGEDVDNSVLKSLAAETGGAVLSADPQSLKSTYLKLSAEQ